MTKDKYFEGKWPRWVQIIIFVGWLLLLTWATYVYVSSHFI